MLKTASKLLGTGAVALSILFTGAAIDTANAQFGSIPSTRSSQPTDLSGFQRQLEAVERRFNPSARGGLGFGDDPTWDFSREVTTRQQRYYDQINSLIELQENMLAEMQQQIENTLRLEHAEAIERDEITAEEITDEARNHIHQYLRDRIYTTQPGLEILSDRFEGRVQGCTLDDESFMFRFNVAYDVQALGSFGQAEGNENSESLLERFVSDNPDHFSGVSGMTQYIASLDNIHNNIYSTMTILGQQLVDGTLTEAINTDIYLASMNSITQSLIDNIAQQYGVPVDIIITEEAKPIPGRCINPANQRDEPAP